MKFRTRSSTAALSCTLVVVLSTFAHPGSAQTMYRYVDQNGKVHYSDRPTMDGVGRATDKLGKNGTVTGRITAPPTAEERTAREAERKRKEEEDIAAQVEHRRNQAILNAYASEQDIDNARKTSLTPVQEIIRETEAKVIQLDKRWKELDAEAKAAKEKRVPIQLQRDLRQTETDRNALNQLLEAKRKEERAIIARFDEDKRRYVEGMKARGGKQVSSTTTDPSRR